MRGPLSRPALVAVLLVTLAWSPRAEAAWPHDPYGPALPVATASGDQLSPAGASDGAGGAYFAWHDPRGGNYDIYAQRIGAGGLPLWAANGIAVCNATGTQGAAAVAPDGSGGLLVVWEDSRSGNTDVYAQRLNAAGVPLWAANGVVVCNLAGAQIAPVVVADGTGGAILAWADARGGAYDLYAQRLNASGAPLWTTNGLVLCNASSDQTSVQLVADGAGGALAAWEDNRGGLGLDVYAQRLNSAGVPLWPVNGVTVCNATGGQSNTRIAADGAGGLLLAWQDFRSGSHNDIYAQRMSASGFSLFPVNGAAVCTSALGQQQPALVPDGSGGMIVAWTDQRTAPYAHVYAQRVSSGGAMLWAANGIAVATAAASMGNVRGVSDGSGGAIFAWEDPRLGYGADLFAQRLSGAGAALWAANGTALCTAVNSQFSVAPVSDGDGGAVIAFIDAPNGVDFDISAARLERYGQLGSPEPVVTGVKDVRNDQGGFVKVSWSASYLDADPVFGVADYRLWRSVPAALAQSSARAFASDPDEAAARGDLLVLPNAAQDYAWELVGSQVASGLAAYSIVAATTADSVPGSFPRTAFMVEARSGTGVNASHWWSAADSGYSVDNLAPAAPAPFTGQYLAGTTALHWNPNHEADLAGYRLYRGTSAAFVPGPANLVTTTPDTGWVDAAAAPFVYKLTAVDAHGNESPVATLLPSGALAVDGGAPVHAFLELAGANPTRGATALRFGLTVAGRACVTVFDATGRRVRTLASGSFAAGEHALAWDGQDDAGHAVRAGLYFVRLAAPGFGATRRLVRTD